MKELIRGSFVPPETIQQLRQYDCRIFDLNEEIVRKLSKLDAVLQRCNIRLSNYVSNVDSKSYKAVVRAISQGITAPRRVGEAKLGGAVTTIGKKVDTINQHIDKVMENASTKLKVSVNVNDADWQKIQELFAKERQWMTSQMQIHIREVNSMFADERKKVRERYKEYDGCYLGHYAQWFFWFFFTIGIFVVAGGVGMIIAQNYI